MTTSSEHCALGRTDGTPTSTTIPQRSPGYGRWRQRLRRFE